MNWSKLFIQKILVSLVLFLSFSTVSSVAIAWWGSVFSQDPDVCIGWECPNLSPWTGPEWLLDSVKRFINYALWLLALLSLIILIYGWFQMVTAAGNQDQYKKWFTILRQAAVWLAFIALSWIIVRFIFFVIWFIV
jgi:hypothetical protein